MQSPGVPPGAEAAGDWGGWMLSNEALAGEGKTIIGDLIPEMLGFLMRHDPDFEIDAFDPVGDYDTLTDPFTPLDLRGGMEEPYDGVAELWWESEAKLIEAGGREESAILVEDERRFIDLQNSPLWFAHEYPQINPLERVVAREFSGVTKLHFALRTPPGMTEEAAQHYWRTAHGPLIRSMAGAGPMLRYLQVHRFDSALENGMRKARGTLVEPYFGHAEAWLDSLRRASGPAAAEQLRRMLEDERKFIDFSRSAPCV